MFHAAAVADIDPILDDLALELFLHRQSAYRGWLKMIRPFHDDSQLPTPLYVACLYDLISVSRYLLNEGADPNAHEGMHSHSAKNADFTRQEGHELFAQTPIGIACFSGHYDVVSMLLNQLHKSDVGLHSWKTIYLDAFWNACEGNHQNVVWMLLTDMSRIHSWKWNDLPFNPLRVVCEAEFVSGFRVTLDHLNDAEIIQTAWSELLQNTFNSSLIHSLSHEIWDELLTKLQSINTDRHILEQLFFDYSNALLTVMSSIIFQIRSDL